VPTQIDAKAIDDVVTVADREAELFLGEGLTKILPEAALVGEEAAHADPALLDRLGDALCWIVDPLDGTNNFAAGKPPFGVMVALAEAGETVAGWIYDPLSGRLCHAHRGEGAWLGERSGAGPHYRGTAAGCGDLAGIHGPRPARSGETGHRSATTPWSTFPAAPPSSTRAWHWG
jgi:fructose-1,6-bisphosphatase/inositol monophosphatase family enzyme